MPRKILPAIRRLAPGPEEKEEKREKKMERMVRLADVLAIINAGMFDLRSSHDNIALQEAIRSLPTVDVDPEPQGEKMQRLIDANEILKSKHQHYNPMADEYYVPVYDIENAPTVDAVPLEDYKSMERTVNKLTKALADAELMYSKRLVQRALQKQEDEEKSEGEKMGTSKKCATCYADTAEWYAIPFFYHNEVNEYISNLILCKECFEHLLDAVREEKEDAN